jgi:peptidoglycan/LPS O-acetylase OafA/YrhL
MISGFILTMRFQPGKTTGFWMRRAARLLPVYYLAWVLTVFGRSLLHWDMTTREMLATLLLVQSWLPDPDLAMAVNPPAWSLSCEAAFYLALPVVARPVLAASRRRLKALTWAVCSWLAVMTAASLMLPLEWWIGLRGAEFGLGVLLAAWTRRGWVPGRSTAWMATASITAAVLITALALDVPATVANLILVPAFLSVTAQSARTTGGCWPLELPALQLLGRLSYSLYISHWIVVVMISRFGAGLPWTVSAAIGSLALAAVLHACVEKPLERRVLAFHSRFRRSATPQRASLENVDGPEVTDRAKLSTDVLIYARRPPPYARE